MKSAELLNSHSIPVAAGNRGDPVQSESEDFVTYVRGIGMQVFYTGVKSAALFMPLSITVAAVNRGNVMQIWFGKICGHP